MTHTLFRLLTLLFSFCISSDAQWTYVEGLAFTGPYALPQAVEPPKPVELEPYPPWKSVTNLRITCMPAPTEVTLPRNIIHWSCAVFNYGSEERRVTEAMVVGALLQAGVSAIRSADVNTYIGERVRLGGWRTASRIVKGLAIPAVPFVISIATRSVKVTDVEAKWAGAAAIFLPWLSNGLENRVRAQPIATELTDQTLAPGEFLLYRAYSGLWTGVTPVEAIVP